MLGQTCRTVGNGLEAVAAVADDPGIELILMDVLMPTMDGIEATHHIRAAEAATGQRRRAIIAVTARGSEDDRRHCLEHGMDDLIAKPVRLDALRQALDLWANRDGMAATDEGKMPMRADSPSHPSTSSGPQP
jgi:CheY-like chemotaxis protein